jgi:hypothetical protein
MSMSRRKRMMARRAIEMKISSKQPHAPFEAAREREAAKKAT